MIKLHAAKGLGDAIYVRAVALYFLDRGEQVTVFTKWPDVFCGLPISVEDLSDYLKHSDLRNVTYSHRLPRLDPGASLFDMRCRTAGLPGTADLRIDWRVTNPNLLTIVREAAAGRKIFLYQPRKKVLNEPMALLSPDKDAFRAVVEHHEDYFRIKLGHEPYVEDDPELPFEMNMLNKGFVKDTFDVCTIGDLFFGEYCFLSTIAEAMDKRVIAMFSYRASMADHWVSRVTPEWMLHKKHLATVVYG